MLRLSSGFFFLVPFFFSISAYARGGGGCFLADTPVMTWGLEEKPISEVHPGDEVLAFDRSETPMRTTVRNLITTQADGFYEIETESGVRVSATAEHPFYVGQGEFRRVKALKVGDPVYVFRDRLIPDSIRSIHYQLKPVTVYNLQTDFPNTFFAAHLAVHNKGGGGGGGGGGRGGSSGFYYGGRRYSSCSQIPDPAGVSRCERSQSIILNFYILLALFQLGLWAFDLKKKHFDQRVRVKLLEEKAKKTETEMAKHALANPHFDLSRCRASAEHAFLMLQKVWEARDYGPMEPLVFLDLKDQHLVQLSSMRRAHEINRIQNLKVDFIRFVRAIDLPKEGLEEFTVLIQAQAKDDYVDDRTGTVLRGDTKIEMFQEFWTFQFQGGRWLLREIEQVADSKVMQLPSRLGADDANLIYMVSSPGVSRLLAQYRKQDPIWDPVAMLQSARAISLAIHHSLERGDSALLQGKITEKFRKKFEEQLIRLRSAGESVSFLNLCVRNVEIVLVSQVPDGYLVRAKLHARRVRVRDSQILNQDRSLAVFESILEFKREGSSFLLDSADLIS